MFVKIDFVAKVYTKGFEAKKTDWSKQTLKWA